jgi:gas vesicle protein
MSRVNVAIGAVAGIAVGALLGVLYAPDKGTETRRKISTKSKDTADSIKHKFSDIAHNISGNGSKAGREAQNMQAEGKVN